MNWIQGYEFTDGDRPVPAKERFTQTSAIYAVYDRFRIRDRKDSERREKIRRVYNGFLPFNPEDLKRNGQAWRTNMNFRQLASMVDARADMVSRLAVDHCLLATLSPVSPEAEGPDDQRISTVIEEEFSRALREDRHVIAALAMSTKEADLYGIGPITWRDPDSYVPEALERAQICFDPEGSINPDDHDVLFVNTTLPATTLFSVLDNQDLAEKVGWNVPAVKRYVKRVFHDQIETKTSYETSQGVPPNEEAVELVRRNDFYETEQFRRMNILSVYVREMKAPRQVTHLIVPACAENMADNEGREILFKRENAYETFDQVMVWQVASLAQRYGRSLRGVSSNVAPIAAIRDRVTCAVVDSTIRALSLVLQQKNPGATPLNTLQELGPYTVVGSDLDPVPNANQMSNFQSALQVTGMLDSLGVGSVAGTTMSPTFPRLQEGGDRPSKADAEIGERRRTERDENASALRILAWDSLFSETFRRFMKIAVGPDAMLREYPHVRRFVDRCSKRGVDKATLREAMTRFTVQTCRDIVIGRTGILQFLADAQARFAGNADEAGRKAMSHDTVRYYLGEKAANRYFPMESRDSSPTNDASVATGENNDMKRLEPAVVAPDQRHKSHILVHMQVLNEIRQQVEQGKAEAQRISQERGGVTQNAEGELAPQVEDPERLASVLQAVSTHIQQHIQFFQTQLAVKDDVKQFQRTLAGMADVIKALNLAIAEQRRVREAEMEKEQREREDLERRASEAETQKARYQIDRDAENERYRIDRMHEVEMAKLQMLGQEGQERLRMDARDREGRARLDFESRRNQAMIDSEMARREMARRDEESRHGMRLAEASAVADASLRESSAAADMMASRQRAETVTGRQPPRPGDFPNPAATDTGVIPL